MIGLSGLADDQLMGGPAFDDLVSAVEWAESRGRDHAVSPKGAYGPMQLMPGAVIDYLMANGLPSDPQTVESYRRDPAKNREIGRWYLRRQYDDFGEDVPRTLSAYNAGPARVKRLGDDFAIERMPAETQKYVAAVQGRLGNGPAQYDPTGGGTALYDPPGTDPAENARIRAFRETPAFQQADRAGRDISTLGDRPMTYPEAGIGAMAQAPQPKAGISALNPLLELAAEVSPMPDRGPAWANALIRAGGAMMASQRPDFLGGMGVGLLAGQEEYGRSMDRERADRIGQLGLGLKLHDALRKDDTPIKLGEGDVLLDRSGNPIASNPKQKEQKTRVRYDGDVEIQEEQVWNGAMNTWREIGRRPRQADDRTLVAIFDPQSPSGVRMVERKDAVGQPGALQQGLQVEVDPKTGQIRLMQGPGAGRPTQTDPATGFTNQTLKDIEEKLLSSTQQAMQLGRVGTRFDPLYQTVGTRLKMAGAEWGEKLGATLDPKTREELGNFTTYRSEAAQFYADRIKEMSGAAVTEGEAKRQNAYLPNAGTGIFDGDSPTQFKSKLDRMQDFMANATARLVYARRAGIDIKSVEDLEKKLPLDQIPTLIRKRGDELAAQIKQQNPTAGDDEIRSAVRQRLGVEFGLFGG